MAAQHSDNYQRFVTKEVSFTTQYAHVYFSRLNAMKQFINLEGDHSYRETSITNLEEGKPAVIVGIVLKVQKKRPSVIEIFSKEFDGLEKTESSSMSKSNLCSDDDTIFIENETGKIQVSGLKLNMLHELVTGLVVGLKGVLSSSGTFEVALDNPVLFPKSPLKLREKESNSSRGKHKILFINGLSFGSNDFSALKVQLLLQTLKTPSILQTLGRIIICGPVINKVDFEADIGVNLKAEICGNYEVLSFFLYELTTFGIPIDIMPSMNSSLTTDTLPQQPMSKSFLISGEKQLEKLNMVTNPHDFHFNSLRFIGIDHSVLSDIAQQTKFDSCSDDVALTPKTNEIESKQGPSITNDDVLKIMERQIFQWRHLAPTAPDTLPMYPVKQFDPFVVNELSRPLVYFCPMPRSGQVVQKSSVTFIQIPNIMSSGKCLLFDSCTTRASQIELKCS